MFTAENSNKALPAAPAMLIQFVQGGWLSSVGSTKAAAKCSYSAAYCAHACIVACSFVMRAIACPLVCVCYSVHANSDSWLVAAPPAGVGGAGGAGAGGADPGM